MTIEKEGKKYCLYCDICGEEAEERFFGFYEAVQYKKQNGWKSQKSNDEWEDVCPECQSKGGY
jgi:hypothetical protein